MSTYLPRNAPGRMGRPLWMAGQAVSRWFDSSVEDLHHLPAGGALLVGNHALLGVDAWGLFPALYNATGRIPRGLAHRNLFRAPVVAHALNSACMVPGDRDLAVRLLRDGEICVCYPGGARDSMKGRDERYTLKWEGRFGFAWAAALAGVPIVPVAAIGPDDAFQLLSANGVIPVEFLGPGLRAPLFVPLARRVKFRFILGQPIMAPSEATEETVRAFAAQTQTALQALIHAHAPPA